MTFLEDVSASVKRGEVINGVRFPDMPVYALEEGAGSAGLLPVTRVGLAPNGNLVVLFRQGALIRPRLILPGDIR